MAKIKETPKPASKNWDASHGTYLSGQASIDGADATAIEMERRWGCGRLRLLVPVELRDRFDRQRFKFNAAIRHGDLQEVQLQSERMTRAWLALDSAATTAGAAYLSPEVWETTLEDGTVIAIVPDDAAASGVIRSGRRLVTYTLEEIGRMLTHYRAVTEVKVAIPGTSVTQIRQSIGDPLDAISDGVSLEETLNDRIPEL